MHLVSLKSYFLVKMNEYLNHNGFVFDFSNIAHYSFASIYKLDYSTWNGQHLFSEEDWNGVSHMEYIANDRDIRWFVFSSLELRSLTRNIIKEFGSVGRAL